MKRKLEITLHDVQRIVAIGNEGTHYYWRHGQEDADYLDRMKERDAWADAHDSARVTLLSGINADYDTESAWIFYVADCFDPPLYLVFGASFQDAYDTFITEFERLIKIDDADLADYGDNLSVNDNGTPVDTESVQFIPVDTLIIDAKCEGGRA